MLAWVDELAVYAKRNPAAPSHFESRGSNDDIGLELLTALTQYPIIDNGVDRGSNNTGFGWLTVLAVQTLEKVAIGRQAHPLFPRQVSWGKVWVCADG